jgi:hypothetical protein
LELKAKAADRDVWFHSTDGETEWIHRFTAEDLRDPRRLMGQVDSPLIAGLTAQYLNSLVKTNAGTNAFSLALKWEAHREWLRIGQNRVRVYRLEARLLDRHRIVVLVSRVGEILRVELPGELRLINDVLFSS